MTNGLRVDSEFRSTGTINLSNGVGASGQVLASTVTGTQWITPSGGGTIGGTAADTRIAFGSAPDTLTSDPDFEVVTSLSGGKRIKVENGGIQIANMTVGATATIVGSMRYRTYSDASFDYSAVDMCMQVGAGAGDYDWVNIVTNRW